VFRKTLQTVSPIKLKAKAITEGEDGKYLLDFKNSEGYNLAKEAAL
jgi:hypothetical protein